MPDETMIPVLVCAGLSELIDFYGALGFEVTHKQSAPYAYLALHRGGIDLHFHRSPEAGAPKQFGCCLWLVPDLAELHRAFAQALRQAYGKLPIAGVPRIARLRKGQRRFTMVDPSGNTVIVIEREVSTPSPDPAAKLPAATSRLARALKKAAYARDVKADDVWAAELLDEGLARAEACPPIDRARALAARAELAVALGEGARLQALQAELEQIVLSDAERELYEEELSASVELSKTQS